MQIPQLEASSIPVLSKYNGAVRTRSSISSPITTQPIAHKPHAEYRQPSPLVERVEAQREHVIDLLSDIEDETWLMHSRIQEAQMAVKRLCSMEEMLQS